MDTASMRPPAATPALPSTRPAPAAFSRLVSRMIATGCDQVQDSDDDPGRQARQQPYYPSLGGNLVLDQVGAPLVVKARGKPIRHPDGPIRRAQ